MVSVQRAAAVAILGLAGGRVSVSGCNVSPPPAGTGAVVVDASAEGGASVGMSTCDAIVDIVCSDYSSTNIAVARLDGTTLSGSFVSSGSVAPGLTLALSGDIEVPFVSPPSGRMILIDESTASVLTWMDPSTAKVIAQLQVGTGFYSNPHDYVEVDSARAFVSRYGTNTHPGQQPFDIGGDLLIVDTTTFAITGRIAIPEENAALQPAPDTMNWLGGEVVVTLDRAAADFSQFGDGRFIGVSPTTLAIDWTVNLAGLKDCGRLAVSPSGKLAAIACSSQQDPTTHRYDPSMSDIVVYDGSQAPPVELRRLGLGVKLGAGLQPQIAFATEDAILALTYGGSPTGGDTVLSVSATTGDVIPLGSATVPYVFGGMRCSPGCGDVCLLSDAQRGTLRRWQIVNGAFTALGDATVDPMVGLPPRTIGGL